MAPSLMHMLEPESEVKAHLELLLVYIHFCMKISKTNIFCFWVVVLLSNMALVFSLMTRQAWWGVNSQKFNMYYFTGFRDGSSVR